MFFTLLFCLTLFFDHLIAASSPAKALLSVPPALFPQKYAEVEGGGLRERWSGEAWEEVEDVVRREVRE